MKVRYIEANGTEVVRVTDKTPSYDRMSKFVGGYIERFTMLVDNHAPGGKPRKATAWVNEEGGLLGLPVNGVVSALVVRSAELMPLGTVARQQIFGNVIIIQSND
jgi:hypothetical protein